MQIDLLRRFTQRFAGFFRRSAVGDVRPKSKAARFLTSSSFFNASGVRSRAFMPHTDGTLSIFIIDGLNAPGVARLASEHVNVKGRKAHGYASLSVSSFISCGLSVVHDEPPRRHAVAARWPPDKGEQKEVALRLAEQSKLNLFKSSSSIDEPRLQ